MKVPATPVYQKVLFAKLHNKVRKAPKVSKMLTDWKRTRLLLLNRHSKRPFAALSAKVSFRPKAPIELEKANGCKVRIVVKHVG